MPNPPSPRTHTHYMIPVPLYSAPAPECPPPSPSIFAPVPMFWHRRGWGVFWAPGTPPPAARRSACATKATPRRDCAVQCQGCSGHGACKDGHEGHRRVRLRPRVVRHQLQRPLPPGPLLPRGPRPLPGARTRSARPAPGAVCASPTSGGTGTGPCATRAMPGYWGLTCAQLCPCSRPRRLRVAGRRVRVLRRPRARALDGPPVRRLRARLPARRGASTGTSSSRAVSRSRWRCRRTRATRRSRWSATTRTGCCTPAGARCWCWRRRRGGRWCAARPARRRAGRGGQRRRGPPAGRGRRRGRPAR